VSVIQTLEVPVTPATAEGPNRLLTVGTVLLFAITLAVTVVRGIGDAPREFDYPYAYVSADVSTMARTFAQVGIFHLHGMPVNNNPPIDSLDFYPHWPPLLPIVLSVCFRVFGVSERVAHLLMLCVLVTTAMLVFRVGQRWLGTTGGAMAGFFWLTLPVTLQFGHLVVYQPLMTMFMVAAVLAFVEGRDAMGAVLLFLGTLSSWEIVLVAVGLLLASRWRPQLRRPAVAAGIGAGAGILCVAALYLWNSPQLAVEALEYAKFYMGMSSSNLHLLASQQIQISAWEQIRRMLLNNAWMLGPIGLGAVLQLGKVRVPNQGLILVSLATPWAVWCVVMKNHMARHHFELVIAAPLVALALAWMAVTPSGKQLGKIVALTAAVGVQILIFPKPVINDGYDPTALIRYAQDIRQATEPNAIVMAPLHSAVPLYYSERHIVREISGAEAIAQQLPILRREFPGSPIYFAVPQSLAGDLPAGRVVSATSDAVIVTLPLHKSGQAN